MYIPTSAWNNYEPGVLDIMSLFWSVTDLKCLTLFYAILREELNYDEINKKCILKMNKAIHGTGRTKKCKCVGS